MAGLRSGGPTNASQAIWRAAEFLISQFKGNGGEIR